MPPARNCLCQLYSLCKQFALSCDSMNSKRSLTPKQNTIIVFVGLLLFHIFFLLPLLYQLILSLSAVPINATFVQWERCKRWQRCPSYMVIVSGRATRYNYVKYTSGHSASEQLKLLPLAKSGDSLTAYQSAWFPTIVALDHSFEADDVGAIVPLMVVDGAIAAVWVVGHMTRRVRTLAGR